jgi:serpin B
LWQYQFSEENTSEQAFHLEPQNGRKKSGTPSVQVDMMTLQGSFLYMKDKWNAYQALLLPYEDGSKGMLILLPKAGRLSQLEKKVDPDLLNEIVGKLDEQEVFLQLPRFELDCRYETLVKILRKVGIHQMFGTAADFSGITHDPTGLTVSKIVHQARIKVDEEGTEAATATAALMVFGCAKIDFSPIPFIVDRPFLFLVCDFRTGALLFIGRVMNPKE